MSRKCAESILYGILAQIFFMYLQRIVLGFILIVTSLASHAQATRFSRQLFISDKGDTLRYRMLGPDYDTVRKFPLVLFLHGSGERGNDNEAQLQWGVGAFASDENMSQFPAFVVAPQCPAGQGWGAFINSGDVEKMRLAPTPSRPMELVMALVKKLRATMNIDTSRIYITGMSMGGYGTFDAVQRYPGLFAAAVPVCGGGDLSGAPLLARVPMWIYHGVEDPAVVPQYSIRMVTELTKAGARPGFTLLPEVGHFSWIAAYNDRMMLRWLFRQKKAE
ncbi:MAG: phospholipase [Chitinophagaceae bacterium]|nr:MAG: phospholipase [Chitinophagaceae bacterium]